MKPTRRSTPFSASALMLLVSLAAADVACAQQPGAGRTIRYSQSNALGATYISDQVAIAALEKLGYKVTVTTLAPTAFFQGASQGDMDMSTSINFPQSAVPYQRVEKQLALVGEGSIVGGGVNGYMVDKKTAEAHKLTSVDQLKDPKIAALFDTNRSGKATLINCDPGWSCGDVVDFQIGKFQVVRTLIDHDPPRIVQAWLTGVNPELGDRIPLRLLREGDLNIVGPEVMAAARAFIAGG